MWSLILLICEMGELLQTCRGHCENLKEIPMACPWLRVRLGVSFYWEQLSSLLSSNWWGLSPPTHFHCLFFSSFLSQSPFFSPSIQGIIIMWLVGSQHCLRQLRSSSMMITDVDPGLVEHTFSWGRVYKNMWPNKQNNQGCANFHEWNKEGTEIENERGTLTRKHVNSEEATVIWWLEGWEGLGDENLPGNSMGECSGKQAWAWVFGERSVWPHEKGKGVNLDGEAEVRWYGDLYAGSRVECLTGLHSIRMDAEHSVEAEASRTQMCQVLTPHCWITRSYCGGGGVSR